MSNLFKEPRICECGYETQQRPSWSRHQKICPLTKDVTTDQWNNQVHSLQEQLKAKDEQLAAKDEQMRVKDAQLRAKDKQMADQLRAKDKQIKELVQVAKKPRVQNVQNTWVVAQNVNCYGKESMDHIESREIQRLLKDPVNAVPQLIKLKHRRSKQNDNIRCPNLKRAMYQVVVDGEDEDGEPMKQWENKAKGEVLEDLYETNAGILEAEADEDDYFGNRFLDHQDKVKASSEGEDGGKRYKEQLDRIHCVITSVRPGAAAE